MSLPRSTGLALSTAALLLLSACGTSLNRAPVEDRMPASRPGASASATPSAVASAAPEVKPPPGAENAGKPGYYTVKAGDNLTVVSKIHGRSIDDLVRWNAIPDKNRIEVGQVLRIVPPESDASVVATAPVVSAPVATSRPLESRPAPAASTPAASSSAAASATPPPAAPAAPKDEDGMSWAWPAANGVTAGFDEQRNKGLDFAGKPGDAVYAAADGRVIHAGAGLRGYGNLVIIKHNDTYLTAYAHNQTLLVKDDQVVRKGQKIAEMGNTESDTVKLHFELRKQGKPVDPAKLLPLR
jgi:lipoprotein NlpD